MPRTFHLNNRDSTSTQIEGLPITGCEGVLRDRKALSPLRDRRKERRRANTRTHLPGIIPPLESKPTQPPNQKYQQDDNTGTANQPVRGKKHPETPATLEAALALLSQDVGAGVLPRIILFPNGGPYLSSTRRKSSPQTEQP